MGVVSAPQRRIHIGSNPPFRSSIGETDASDYAIAGIHSLHTEDGEIRPVAFSQVPNSITILTTRNCSLSSKPSRPGAITSSLLITLSTLSQTTRISSISLTCQADYYLNR